MGMYAGWQMHQAMRVINAVRDLDVYIEQPCLTYDECLSVRRQCPLPFVMDECMDDIGEMIACLIHGTVNIVEIHQLSWLVT